MLFAVKNRFWLSLLLLAVFVAVFIATRFQESWQFSLPPKLLMSVGAGMGLLAASDGLLHVSFLFIFGRAYRNCYVAFVGYFRPQGVREIIAGGLLAGAEELIFRGILLQDLISRCGVTPFMALVTSSMMFASCHLLPGRRLRPFGLWAFWEGALLGGIYLWSGSLFVCVVLHILHDIAGFCLLAWQRRTGWLM